MRHALLIGMTLAAGLAVAAPMAPAAADGILGNLFSRISGERTETVSPRVKQDQEMREREVEARNLRRGYWERERERMQQRGAALNQPTSLASR